MTLCDEDQLLLRSQLEGLESIFLELIPFGVELKRQQVQDYYNKRFNDAVNTAPSVAEKELRRQFNTKANNVRNLIDNAESLGSVGDRFNLIKAAASIAVERNGVLNINIVDLCRRILNDQSVDGLALNGVLAEESLQPVEARVLLGCLMFLIVEELSYDGKRMEVREILAQILKRIKNLEVLTAADPFLIEAQCVLDAVQEDVPPLEETMSPGTQIA